MSKLHYVIKFNSKQSSINPYGQKGTYPLSSVQFAYGVRSFNGMGDRKGETIIDTTYFTLNELNNSEFDQVVLQDLQAYIDQLLTTKMAPDTITVYEIATSDDSANYKIVRQVEHPEALIGDAREGYVIVSDKATLSTIPVGGKDATYKTAIDFKNRQVNAK